MLNGKLLVWSEPKDFKRRLDVLVLTKDVAGREWVASPLVFTECTESLVDKPTIAGDGAEFLQAVLDHAWSIGMRPAGFSDVPLQVQALKDHLHDMRALVFKGVAPVRGFTDEAFFEAAMRDGHKVQR